MPWFGCACCPPNVARLFASLGAYACAQTPDGLAVHLYTGGEINFTAGAIPVRLHVQTEYPWKEQVELSVELKTPAEFTLQLRVPGWCRAPQLRLNGRPLKFENANGYAALRRKWQTGDRIALELPMPVERVHADVRVAAAAGLVALQRGPVVYCVEEKDNGPLLAALILPRASPLTAHFVPDLLGGCTIIEGAATRTEPGAKLYTTEPARQTAVQLRAVPYALWANRSEGEMRVWLRET